MESASQLRALRLLVMADSYQAVSFDYSRKSVAAIVSSAARLTV
jgi:hypothetical protein